MEEIASLIKDEIKKQYGSVWRFSKESGIPYSTITNMIGRGLSGTSYGLVMRVCKMLNIRQVFDEDPVLLSGEFYDVYSKMAQLDDKGVTTVSAVLNAEYLRCAGKDDPVVKGLSGASILREEDPFTEKRLRTLVRKAKARKQDE